MTEYLCALETLGKPKVIAFIQAETDALASIAARREFDLKGGTYDPDTGYIEHPRGFWLCTVTPVEGMKPWYVQQCRDAAQQEG